MPSFSNVPTPKIFRVHPRISTAPGSGTEMRMWIPRSDHAIALRDPMARTGQSIDGMLLDEPLSRSVLIWFADPAASVR